MKNSEESLQDLWDTINRSNIHIMRIPERGEKREQSIFKAIMAENFPNLGKEMDIQIHEAQRTSNRLSLNRVTPRHIIIKLSKVKERILKAAREKREVTYKGTS